MSDDLYAQFDRKKSRAENDWIRNFVLPFHNAYIDAHKNFMDKIDEQKKADEEKQKRIAELAMLALTFCGGKALSAVFASAALKTHAAEIAVDFLARHNMNRTFTAIMFVAENKTAQFALGKLWDKGQDLLSSELKKQLEETDKNFPTLADFALSPAKMGNHLEKWVRDVLARVLAAEDEISSQIKDQQRRATAIQNLLDAPFLSTAPEKSLATSRTIEEMELSFYMRYILDLDYIASGHYYNKTMKGDSWEYSQVDKRTPVSESPSSTKYPQGEKRNGKNFKSVGYFRVGSILRGRIDELAKKRLGGAFFLPKEHISRDTLRRAESKLGDLATSNIDAIKKSFSGPLMPDAVSGAARRVN